MSQVQLFIIKDDCVFASSVHYRSASKLLESGFEGILPLLKSRFLDAGYLVVDLNKRVVINGQSAFHLRSKKFSVVDA